MTIRSCALLLTQVLQVLAILDPFAAGICSLNELPPPGTLSSTSAWRVRCRGTPWEMSSRAACML